MRKDINTGAINLNLSCLSYVVKSNTSLQFWKVITISNCRTLCGLYHSRIRCIYYSMYSNSHVLLYTVCNLYLTRSQILCSANKIAWSRGRRLRQSESDARKLHIHTHANVSTCCPLLRFKRGLKSTQTLPSHVIVAQFKISINVHMSVRYIMAASAPRRCMYSRNHTDTRFEQASHWL